MKSNTSLAVLLATLGSASVASAQDFAEQGTFIIAVDRPVGYTHAARTVDPDGTPGQQTTTIDNVALLTQGSVNSPFSGARASFDYFVIDGLSIGGSLGYWTRTGEVETETAAGTVTNNLDDQNGFIFAPRIGYALMFSDAAGWWPRGGFSFFSLTTDSGVGGGEASESGLAFDVDLPFVFVPVEHAAILVGPALDVTLGASGEYDPGPVVVNYDVTYFDIGIYAGLGFWL